MTTTQTQSRLSAHVVNRLLRENRNSFQKKKKKKNDTFLFLKSNYLDFKFDLGKLNNKIFPHTAQC